MICRTSVAQRWQPKVSIITPTYNRASYLPQSLESALGQTYRNIEIIVVNDGSTDDTEEVLRPYRRYIRYVKQANQGCAAAKNTGLELATGDFVNNLDDDDWIHPEKIEKQVEAFREHPEWGLCATGAELIDAQGKVTAKCFLPQISPDTQVLQLLRHCLLIQSSVLIARRCHEHLGGYRHMLSEDYDFWLRCAPHYPIGVVPETLTQYRRHENQITGEQTRPELTRAVKQLLRDFVQTVPMDNMIPGLCSVEVGHAILALILGEQRLLPEAHTHVEKALPGPAGRLVLGMLHVDQGRCTQARTEWKQVKREDVVLTPYAERALAMLTQMSQVTQIPGISNTSQEVVALRRELSHLKASIIGCLLRLARGEKP